MRRDHGHRALHHTQPSELDFARTDRITYATAHADLNRAITNSSSLRQATHFTCDRFWPRDARATGSNGCNAAS